MHWVLYLSKEGMLQEWYLCTHVCTYGIVNEPNMYVCIRCVHRCSYLYKNNLKIMDLKRGVGIDHCHKK